MNTKAVNVAVVEGKTITEATELRSNPQGQPVRIKAVANGKYILAEGDKGVAPENITIKRVGKDLHVALEGTDPDQPQLIIEGFFDATGQLVGVAEDGAYHEYIDSDAEQDHEAALLIDGVSSPQVLGAEQLSGFDDLVAGTGMGWFWPALLGLGALAAAGAIWANNREDGDHHHDPLIPPIPVLDEVEDNVGDKTGKIEKGDTTDDTTPTFSGTGTPGSTIIIKDGDKAIGEAVVDNDGKWTFTPETPLAEGDHNVVIVEKDPAGNQSAPSPGFDFTIDITAPGQSMIKEALDDVGDHQGVIAQDGVTDDNTPTLKGTAEPDSTLEVFANGEKIGTTVVDHDGNWTFTPDPALADGKYSFTTVAVDASGNRGLPSLPYDLVVDTRGELVKIEHVTDDAGSIVGELQNGGVTDDTTPTLSGQATPNTQVNIYDNGVLLGTAPVDANGQWTFTPATPLNEGQHGFTATVVTPASGESTPTPVFDLEIDTTAPGKPGADGNGGIDEVDDNVGLIQGPIENGGYTDDTTPTLSGGGQEPGDKVTIIDNGNQIGEVIVDEGGNWSYTPDPALSDGDHDFTIIVTDPAGNASEESDPYKVVVDTQAPAAPAITSVYDDQGDQTGNLAQGSLTDDAQPDITGTAEPGSTVIIYDNGVEIGRAPVDDVGQWTFTPTLPLANGPHDLTAKAEDKAGNISEPSDPFDFDLLAGGVPTAPAITGVIDDVGSMQGNIAPGGVTDDTRPTITGTGQPGTTVNVYNDGVLVGTGTVGSDGQWSVPLKSDLHENLNNLTAQTVDSVGNLSLQTGIYPVILDTTPPAAAAETLTDDVGPVVGTINDNDTTDDNTPTASGTAEPGTTVIIYDKGVEIGRAPVKDDGTWSFTPNTPLADGDHSFSTVVEDAAGNQSPKSDDTHFTIDTSKVEITITQVIDDEGSVTGALTNGGVTDDTTPTIIGQATPNSNVNIYDNGVLIGTSTSDATGKWSFTPTTPLTEGNHSLAATVVTAAGGESPPTSKFGLEVDTTAPAKPGIDEVSDDVGIIQGPIAEGGSTDDTTPTLSGGGQQPGDTVTIIDNGTIIGTAPVKDDGSWEFTPNPPLNDGDHDFTIIVTDPAGNASEESDPYKVIIDTQAPAKPEITSVYDDQGDKTGVIAKGSITDDAQPDIKGTAEPGSTVIIYDGGKEIGRAPVDANGDWSFTPTLPLINGPHELTAKSEDLAGNISGPCDPFDFNLITGGVPPAPAITGALDDVGSKQGNISPGGVTDDKRPIISGTGEPGTTVKVYADGVLVGTGTVKADGQWSVDLTQDLKESLNNITATTTNGAGNVSPETGIYPIIVDTTAPAASAETLSDDVGPVVGTINDNDTTDDNTPTASGTAEPGTTVIIYDKGVEIGRAPVKDDGTWSFTPNTPLADGDHSFSTVVEDAAGNQSPKSDDTHFTIDTSKVEITITQVIDDEGSVTGALTNGGVTDDTTPTIIGQATPNSNVNIYDNGVLIGTSTSDATGKWSFTPTTPLTEGNHSLAATVVTAAGGESPPTSKFGLEVDTTAPAKPGIDEVSDDVGIIQGPIAEGGSTDDTTPTLSGGGQQPGDTVTIIDNGTIIGTAPVKDDGSWEFTPNPPLNDGDHDFTIIVTDPAGNASEESDPYKVIIDTQAPAKPEITSVYDDQGDKTGVIAKGSITDDAQPDIKGTAEPGSTVIIYDGGKEIGRAPVDANGDWSFTPTLPLINGPHELTAKSEDLAGNISGPCDPFDFNLITGGVPPAPAITGALDDVGSKQGNISPGGVTDDKRPIISGTGEPGTTVKVYADGVLVGTGTVKADGQWSVDLTQDLKESLNNITATTTNGAGNVSPETGIYPIIVDTTAPAASAETLSDDVGPVVGTINDNDTTDDNTPTASGTAEPGTTVIIYDKGVEIGRAPVKDDGTWSFTPNTPLADGDHSFSTVVEDAAGNQSPKSDDTHFTIDTSKVEITITQVIDDEGSVTGALTNGGVTDDTTPTIIGQATPNSNVNIYDNGVLIGTSTSDATGKWSFTPTTPLTEGNHSLAATVVTAAGGESPPTSKFGLEVDTTAPAKPGIDEVSDDVGIIQGPIAEGGSTDDTTPTLSGGGQQPGDTVTIIDNGTIIGTAPVKDDGSWEFTPNPPLNDGDHDFTIIVTDPAGNASEESDPYPVNIDTTAPVANAIAESMSKDSGANHTDFLTNDGTRGRLISGSLTAAISADERVQVSLDGGKTWQDAILNGSNSWSFVDDNSHTADWEIQTRVVDKAGNVGTVSTQDVTLDTEAPDAPDSFSINGSTVTVQFDGSSLKAGDTLQIIVGDKHFDQALTQAQIDAGSVDILAPGAQMTNTSAAFIDQVGNVSQSLIFKLAEVDFESATPERVEVNAVRDFGAFTFSWGNYANETAGWPRGIIASGVSLSDLGTAHSAGLGMWSGGSTNPSLTLNNGETATQASFSIGGLHVDKTVSFYDADNHLIHSILVATKGVSNIQTIDVPMPAGQEFARIEFKGGVGDWFWLDDIQFTLTSGAGFQHVDPAVSQVVSESAAYNGGDEDNIFSVQDVTVLGGGNTHINAGSGLDTLKLTGKDQVLDLTQLGEKISSIEVIDLTGSGNNTLNLSLSDVLEQGTTSLFTEDDHVQMMVKGNAGDTVNLDELLADGTDPGNWANSGQVTVGGVEYEVYRHDALDAELLVQQGVQTNLV